MKKYELRIPLLLDEGLQRLQANTMTNAEFCGTAQRMLSRLPKILEAKAHLLGE